MKLYWPYLYSVSKEKNNEVKRILKTQKAAENLFGTIYFTCITALGFYVLRKTDYLPWMLGGKAENDMNNVWVNFPVVDDREYAEELKIYFLVSYGYHLSSLFDLIKTNREAQRSDFIEMLLHHLLTCLLILLAYMSNVINFGSLILFIHDWADIPCSIVKIAIELEFEKPIWISAMANLFVWAWSRLFVFPQVIYFAQYIAFDEMVYPQAHVEGHID